MACAAVPLASAALSAEVLNPWPMTLVSSLACSWRATPAQIFASSSLLPANATPRQSRTATLAVAIALGGRLSNFSLTTNCAIFVVISIISPRLAPILKDPFHRVDASLFDVMTICQLVTTRRRARAFMLPLISKPKHFAALIDFDMPVLNYG